MMKRIGRPILLCIVAVAGVLGTSAVASATGGLGTTTTVIQTPASPTVGQPVTYAVTVAYSGVGGAQAPTGTVTFTDLANSTPGCTTATLVPTAPAATSGASTASCTTTYTKAETGNFEAAYGGDANYAVSNNTQPDSVTIGQGTTTTTIAASTTTPVTGQSVVFTAKVQASGETSVTPTGTVDFSEAGGPSDAPVPTSCATAALTGTGGTATATCSVVFGLANGPSATYSAGQIHAVYNGDTNFPTSNDGVGDATITSVTPATTRVIVTSSPSPSLAGAPVTFTASVVPTAPGSGVPSGTVTFGSTPACTGGQTATLSSGAATCTVASDTLFVNGSENTVTATYGGTADSLTVPTYNGSAGSETQSIEQNPTSTTLIASPAKPTAGGTLSLTAVILAPAPGTGPVTGNVTFIVAGKHSGSLTCNTITVGPGGASQSNTNNISLTSVENANEVTCVLDNVPADANPLKVSATYAGDPNYFGSSSKTAKLKLS
jgi:Big-like domain-containing protein